MDMMREGSFAKAHQSLLEANMLSLNNRDRVFTPIIGRMLGDICVELGELHQAASYYQHMLVNLQRHNESGEDFLRVQSLCGLGRLSYEWNELEKAEQFVQEISLYHYTGQFPSGEEEMRLRIELLTLRLLHACGKMDEVRTALSALRVRLQATPHTLPLLPDVLIWQARWHIRDGDLAAAERTFETLAQSETGLSPLHQQEMHLLYARLHLAQGEAETALSELLPRLAFAQQGQHLIRVLEIQLLIALAYGALQQQQESRQHLISVLSQARSENLMRLFLDEGEPLAALLRSLQPSFMEKPLRIFTQRLLHAFAPSLSTNSTSQTGTESLQLEPLSAQEQRVLTLLVAGRSNPEIAEILIVSVNTVKAHVKNLYRKLGVTNRVEAGLVARSKKLISH
jgi:LuxR family maltose regulon positive regulatory protein